MLIALFALTNLAIFRKPPRRCGNNQETSTTTVTKQDINLLRIPNIVESHTALAAAAAPSSTMSTTNSGQDQPLCASNANGGDASKDVEIITFKPYDKQCCRVIKSNNTHVYTCGGTHGRGSSKVKLKNVVDYKWENKYYYPGHLVAVHRDGKHLAYAINVNNKASGMEGMVRVCNISASLRALIKGMNGEVLDLQFAHTQRERILCVIDVSSLFVYKIDMIDSNLTCHLVLKIEDPIANYTPQYDMVSWCPSVSSTTNTTNASHHDEDENQLLIWSRSSQFQCFHIKMIVADHGVRSIIKPSALETGYLKIEEDALITCTALSPDGTTVAAACADGLVRFYQIYLFDVRNHRCLHEWKPHDGKVVSSLFFLDNINKPMEDSYWQHVITTSDFNTEIKLWNCSLWECLQTINIVPSLSPNVTPQFIAGIDRSANYLVISSLDSVAVYVMQISNSNCNELTVDSDSDNDGNTAAADDGKINLNSSSLVRIQNIAEFKLSLGILSFSIVNASMRPVKSTNESYYSFEGADDYDDDINATTYALVVHMFVVQIKSLQECQIIYQPCVASTELADCSLNSSSSTNNNSSIANATSSSISNKKSTTPDESQLILASSNNNGGNSCPELDAIFAKVSARANNNSSNAITTPTAAAVAATTTTTTQQPPTQSTSVVAVAVAVAAAAAASEAAAKSGSTSPQYTSGNPGGGGFPQLNLMTPDAFSATQSNNSSNNSGGVIAENTTSTNNTDAVNTQVLNTLRMLATVHGQGTDTNTNTNLLNLMNNTLIEDREQQKQQLKEQLDSLKNFIAIDRNPERNTAENLASGGSSPSREVQEIMATQDDEDDYDAELDNLDDDEEEEATSSPLLLEETDVEQTDGESNNTKWLNDVHTMKKSAELQNAANIISQVVNKTNAPSNVPPTLLPISSTSTTSSNNNNNNIHNISSDNSNSQMNAKLDQLMELVKMQSQQLNKLELEVTKLQHQQLQQQQNVATSNSLQPKNINELAYKLEMQLCKLMEQYLKRYENEHKKKLAEFLQAKETQNREQREAVIQVLNQYVMSHFTDIIGNVLNMELQRQLIPRVNAKMDQLQTQMQMEVVQKLSVFDKMVKENIAQVCKSKPFLDAFGKSVLIGVQTGLQTAFIESMSSTLIPAYEKSSQNMFKQLHDAFSVGIKDFMVQFNAYLQHLPQSGENNEELQNKLTGFRQSVEQSLHKHRIAVNDAMVETQHQVKGMEILLARQVQETIRSELRKHLAETQNLALRSQAATPAPTYDLRDTIKQLLHAGQINKAFHQALLANDLNLVEFTLRHTDRSLAFAPEGCHLEQKVLLSLIQQISADMSNHNELKQSYLNEALLAINMSDPITSEHAPKVLTELYRNCQMFLKNCPKNTQCSNVRLLMKAILSCDQYK